MSWAMRVLLIIGSVITAFYVLKKIRRSRMRTEDSLFWLLFALILVMLLACASVVITCQDIDSRLAFNEEKDNFLDSINNNGSVIVYNTDYGYKVVHNDLNNTKQYTLSGKYFYDDDIEVCKDFDKVLKDNRDKKVYLVNWKLKESNKKYEENYNLTKVYDADHYSFNLVGK